MRRTRDAQTALNYLKDVPTEVLVRVFETSEEDQVRLAGGQPVQTADAAAEQFLRWADVNLGELDNGTLTC